MAATLPRRLLPAVAAALFMAGHGARLEARRLAPTAWPSSPMPARRGDRRSARLPLSTAPRRWAARRHWLPSAAFFLAGVADMACAAEKEGGYTNRLAETFASLDTNGDKLVSVDEFLYRARIGLQLQDLTPQEVDSVLNIYRRLHSAADMNGDELLNQRELEYSQHLAAPIMTPATKETWQQLAQTEMGERDAKYFTHELADPRFGKMDLDGDGRVSKDEFWQLMGEATVLLGFQDWPDADADVGEWMEQLWAKADVSVDGFWDRKEFDYSAYLIAKDIQQGIFFQNALVHDMFEEIDSNGDGRLDLQEIQEAQEREQARRAAGKDTGNLAAARLQQIRFYFATADEDEDGSLDYAEAQKLAARIISEM